MAKDLEGILAKSVAAKGLTQAAKASLAQEMLTAVTKIKSLSANTIASTPAPLGANVSQAAVADAKSGANSPAKIIMPRPREHSALAERGHPRASEKGKAKRTEKLKEAKLKVLPAPWKTVKAMQVTKP